MVKSKQKHLSLEDHAKLSDESKTKSKRKLASSFKLSLGTVYKVNKERKEIRAQWSATSLARTDPKTRAEILQNNRTKPLILVSCRMGVQRTSSLQDSIDADALT